ncbi:MAG TPA: MBL fold metallo-hydrolase [Synergistales bacterium]|nr:MBL fold metallo-hydrolase [Synergistales bacterium]
MKITVVVENFAEARNVLGEYGLSVLVEDMGHRVLVDTGQGRVLFPNMQSLEIDPRTIEHLVLSHGHFDHAGGLNKLLLWSGDIPVWAHSEIEIPHTSLKEGKARFIGCHINLEGIDFRPITGLSQVTPKVWAMEIPMDRRDPSFMNRPEHLVVPTEEGWVLDPFPDDISLVVKGENGLIVLLGCAHAGVVNILEEASARFDTRKFHMVMGGMHIGDQSHDFIDRITTELTTRFSVEKWRPCHCTGLKALCALSSKAADVSWAGAGSIFFI